MFSYILDFKLSLCSECWIVSSGWFPCVWILCADVSEQSVCQIFIVGVRRKNNWDDVVRVLIQVKVKVWLKTDWANCKEGKGNGACLIRETGCGGDRPQVEACSNYVGRNCPVSERMAKAILSQTFTFTNTLAISSQLFFLLTSPMTMELTVFRNVGT